jgi:hypothetical protein
MKTIKKGSNKNTKTRKNSYKKEHYVITKFKTMLENNGVYFN